MRLSCSELLPDILLTPVRNGLSAAVHTWKGGPQNKVCELCDAGVTADFQGLPTDRSVIVYAQLGGITALFTFPEVGSLAVRFRQPGLLSRGRRPQQRLGLKPLRGIFDANPKLWVTYVSS